jgi:hypothetical protein
MVAWYCWSVESNSVICAWEIYSALKIYDSESNMECCVHISQKTTMTLNLLSKTYKDNRNITLLNYCPQR